MRTLARTAAAIILPTILALSGQAAPILSASGSGGGIHPLNLNVTLVNQPDNTGLGLISQAFPDAPAFSTFAFDDFQTNGFYRLNTLTVFGFETGDPSANVAVTAEIWNGLPGTGAIVLSTTGTEDASGNLQFDFHGAQLPPGSFWLSAFVTRPFNPGGQWFWEQNEPVVGSESFLWNPGDGFGAGTNPQTASSLLGGSPANQAFILDGDATPIPEPSSAILFALAGSAGVLVRRWRKRLV